jgi:chromosome segregation ATPase
MTSVAPDAISLGDVRSRFMQAEESLIALAATMRSLEEARDRLDVASGGVSTAYQGLLDTAKQLAPALSELTASIGLVRQAVSLLERSDPGVIQGRLATLTERLPTIEGEIGAVRTALDVHASQIVVVLTERQVEAAERLLAEYRQTSTARTNEVKESIELTGQRLQDGVGDELARAIATLRDAVDAQAEAARTAVAQISPGVRAHTSTEVTRLIGELQRLDERVKVVASEAAASHAERARVLEARLQEISAQWSKASAETTQLRHHMEKRLTTVLGAVGVVGVLLAGLSVWAAVR